MVTEQTINVVKRGIRGKELLNIEKIHEMVEYACEDISGVSASQVEMSSGLQFYDGISTDDIQQILIKSAADLISLESPNYQFVAARLLLYGLRKQVIGKLWDHPHFYEHIKKCINKGVYDKEILVNYEKKDFDRMENWIVHERDYTFTYAGLRQVIDKYLVQDRSNGDIYETPQFMYMMISATVFAKYPKSKRMTFVKKYYDAICTPTLHAASASHPADGDAAEHAQADGGTALWGPACRRGRACLGRFAAARPPRQAAAAAASPLRWRRLRVVRWRAGLGRGRAAGGRLCNSGSGYTERWAVSWAQGRRLGAGLPLTIASLARLAGAARRHRPAHVCNGV